MANEAMSQKRGINKSWAFLAFIREFGQPRYVDDFQGTDGNTFCALSFAADTFGSSQRQHYVDKTTLERKESAYVMVSFSSNLGELSEEQLMEQCHDLQIVELNKLNPNDDASFKICMKGEFEQRGHQMHFAV